MKQNIATTPEQSKRLLACGVKPETADMEWQPTGLKDDYRLNVGLFLADAIPAWSLSALLAILPKEIADGYSGKYYLSLAQEYPLLPDYSVAYKHCYALHAKDIADKHDPNPIEAAVQMIEWLTANGYSLNNIKQLPPTPSPPQSSPKTTG